MAHILRVAGVLREIYQGTQAAVGGNEVVDTGIRISAGQLSRVRGLLTITAFVGAPVVTAAGSVVNGRLVVTIANNVGGSSIVFTLDIELTHSVQQAQDPTAAAYIQVASGTAGGLAAPETLAVAYTVGAGPADQTILLTDTDGGGILIDATDADFTDTSALEIRQNHLHDSPLLLSRYLGGISSAGPNLTFYREHGLFGANGNVVTDDEFGTLDFSGYNAGAAATFARILSVANNVGAGPGFLLNSAIDFWCAHESTMARSWRMDQSADGAVLIGYGGGGSPNPVIVSSSNATGSLGLLGTQWNVLYVYTANVYENVCLRGATADAAAHGTVLLPVAGVIMPAPQVGQVYLGAETFAGDSGQGNAALALVSGELAIAIGQNVATHLVPIMFNGHAYYLLAMDDEQQN